MRNINTTSEGRTQKFNFKNFVQLITKIKPRFWQLGLGLLLGIIATGMQLIVPKVAQQLINQLGHSINMQLIGLVIALFVFGALISAGSGAILGFFGENVVNKLRQFYGTRYWCYRSVILMKLNLARWRHA